MFKRYYAIHDKIAKTYSGLFEQQNDAVASRLFESQQKNKDSFISMKPEDFQLHYICTMEDETGQIIDNTKMLVCEGKPNE
jgi:23S rRNA maturation-related 3'-5' exoribonuclease YhaM